MWDSRADVWEGVMGCRAIQARSFEISSWFMIFQMTVRGNWRTNLGIEKLSTDESRELKCAISSLIGVRRKMILSGQTGME